MAMAAPGGEAALELLLDGARYGDLEDVQAALSDGADINGKDDSARTGAQVTAGRTLGRAW